MKNRTLSLLISTALTLPSLAMAAPETTAAVDMQDPATATTFETEVGATNNESVSNQSSPFQISETQRISKASVNSNANQQLMASAPQAQQQAMLLEKDAMQNPQESMQARQQAMQQARQQAMQDLEEAMQQQDMLDEEDLLESEEDDQ